MVGRSRSRLIRLAVAGIAAPLVLAACSSSSGSGSSSPASGSSGTGTAAAGAPIEVGGIGGVSLLAFQGMDTGFEARIARTNAAGGIDGHKIVFKQLFDDQLNPTSTNSDINQLVLNDHVFAIAPFSTTGVTAGTASFLQQNNVPMLGYALDGLECASKVIWPTINGGCSVQAATVGQPAPYSWLLSAYAKAAGKSASSVRSAVVLTQNPTTIKGVAALGQTMTQQGATVVYADNTVPAAPEPSYTAVVQQILSNKPNAVFLGLPTAVEVSVVQALRAAGYTGDVVSWVGIPTNMFTTQPTAASALNGTYQENIYPEPTDSTAASQQEVTDLKAAGIYAGDNQVSIGQSIGYWTADQFVDMLTALAKTGQALTSANLITFVNSGKYTYQGAAGSVSPMPWPASENSQTANCAGVIEVNSPAKTYTPKLSMTCFPGITLKAAGQIIS